MDGFGKGRGSGGRVNHGGCLSAKVLFSLFVFCWKFEPSLLQIICHFISLVQVDVGRTAKVSGVS